MLLSDQTYALRVYGTRAKRSPHSVGDYAVASDWNCSVGSLQSYLSASARRRIPLEFRVRRKEASSRTTHVPQWGFAWNDLTIRPHAAAYSLYVTQR